MALTAGTVSPGRAIIARSNGLVYKVQIYLYSILMPTTVHLPPDLLESVDRRADELEISRNRYIVQALQQSIDEETAWSPLFLEAIASARSDKKGRELIGEMNAAIEANRTRKAAVKL